MSTYSEVQGVNQSTLKEILKSPKSYLAAKKRQESNQESEEEHFVFGTVLDIMLTGKREDFDKRFVKVPDSIKGSANVILMLKTIREELNLLSKEEALTKTLSDYELSIVRWARQNKYQERYSDAGLIKNLITDETKETFEILKTTVGKTVIKEGEYKNALQCKSVLENDLFTKQYVDRKFNTDCEFLDKFIVNFTFRDVLCRGELDRLRIDHTKKEITPIDFKYTGKPINDFMYDFWKYRYDFQASFYKHGLFEHSEIQKLLKDGYKINNFLYIVVEKALYQPPYNFRVTDQVNIIGREGGVLSTGKRLEGFVQAIDRYKFATQNNKWDYPMEIYQNDGMLDITV